MMVVVSEMLKMGDTQSWHYLFKLRHGIDTLIESGYQIDRTHTMLPVKHTISLRLCK